MAFDFDIEKYPQTHMPFAEYDNGRIREFGCVMVGGKWKVHELIDHEWYRIDTGLPDDATECSPFGWWDTREFHVQFIGGASVMSVPFRLYELDDDGSHEIVVSAVGMSSKGFTVHGNGSNVFDIEKPDSTRLRVTLRDVEHIYRITHNAMNPVEILVSVEDAESNVRTIAYDFWRDRCFELIADGKPTYKPCIIGNVCAHALKCGEDFEDRRIVTTGDWELRRIDNIAEVEEEQVVEED